MTVWHKNAYNVCPLSIHYAHFTLAPQCLFDVEHLFDFIVKFCLCFYVKLCLYVMFFRIIVYAWNCFQNHVFVWRYISSWIFVSLWKSYSSLCIFYEWQQLSCVAHDYYFIFLLFCILCCVSWIMKEYHMLMDIEDNSTIAIRFCFIDLAIANNLFSNWYAPLF
jgi:hypothetical protein